MNWDAFTPWSATLGGVLIGLATALLLFMNGRIAGISGIIGGLFRPSAAELPWRILFLSGLLVAPTLLAFFRPLPTITFDAGPAMLVVAGLLVGAGTRFAGGCTSGHGVCGVSRLSRRSLVATSVFMGAGFVTVFVLRHVLPG